MKSNKVLACRCLACLKEHLVHKTVLTIVAWLLFSVLLWGHYQLGWRSQTAVRFTLAGFTLLMLAYFGSKMVLELLLQAP